LYLKNIGYDMKNEWTRTVVHTEDYKESRITVSHYTNGIVRGSYTYDVHWDGMNHPDPIASSRGESIEDCVKKAKTARNKFWKYVDPDKV